MEKVKFGHNKTALIVDDEKELREAIRYDFVKKGFKVFTSNDGNEAEKILKAHQIDVVVSDIQMPDCDGICLLKKSNMLPFKPVFLFMSGFTIYREEDLEALGALALISKPINRKEMFRLIENALEG